jgi:hypothetical protein
LRTQTSDKALKQEYERKFNQLWEELMDWLYKYHSKNKISIIIYIQMFFVLTL